MSARRFRIAAAPAVAVSVVVLVVGVLVGPGAGTSAYAVTVGQIQVTVTSAESFLEEFQGGTFSITTNINGENVDDGESFPVFFTGASTVQVGTLTEDDSDIFGGTFSPSGAVCGTNTVTVKDVLDGETLGQGSTTIFENCPAIQLNPATVAQSAEPTTIQVTGTEFLPAIAADVTLGDAQAEPDVTGRGTFTTPITVRGLACGTYPVTAAMVLDVIQAGIQGSGAPAVLAGAFSPLGGVGMPLAAPTSTAETATAPLTVTCPSSPSPSASASPSASPSSSPSGPPGAVTLTASPDVVSIGSVTSVTGTGFAPNTPVTLSWQIAPGVTLPATTTPINPDATGAITDPLIVLLPAAPGKCSLIATQGTATASAPMVVQNGSMEPSTGGQGNDQLIFRE